MATYNKFQDTVEQIVNGVHDFDSDTFKVMLVNSPAPVNTNTVKADLTEISAGNGYSAGGATTTVTTAEASGVATVSGTQVVFTASGGTIGPFRYAVLYNDTASSPEDALIAWWDYGTSITLNDTETFTVKFNNTSPGAIFTLT
jgi:hypothetical protein